MTLQAHVDRYVALKRHRLWLAGSAAFVKVLTVVQFWELWHNRWRGDREPECGWESD